MGVHVNAETAERRGQPDAKSSINAGPVGGCSIDKDIRGIT